MNPTTTTKRRSEQQIYIANESFVASVNGVEKAYHQGLTRVYEDDPVLDQVPQYFDLLDDRMAVGL